MSKEETKKTSNIIGTILLIIIPIIIGVYFFLTNNSNLFFNNEDIDKNKCNFINLQTLHNDYTDNEISAKDKYTGNYYCFTEEIHDITEYLDDKYITFRLKSEKDNLKIIEIDAYFKDRESLKNLEKGDLVTIYGKFKQRSIKNYANISAYSFEFCKVEKH